jgi:RNA polymerase sigma-70 factor, ECF subfamily
MKGKSGILELVASSLQLAIASLVRTGQSGPSRLEDEVTGYYDEFRAPVLRYLCSMRIPPDDAEEIVQEVFLALFRHLRLGKPRGNLRGWIFRVAHNLALKNRIARFRHPAGQLPQEQRDPGPDPEQIVSGSERTVRLAAVLRALPEQERQCLSLRAEGFRYREIAGIVGISLGSVANALERSLGKLSRAGGSL